MTPKIFGREPAVLASLVEALLALLISFHALAFVHLDDQTSLVVVMAVVNGGIGVYVAWVTRDTLLAATLALAKALIAFGAVYGLSISTEQTGTLIAFLTVAIGLYQRTQTGPSGQPSFTLDGGAGGLIVSGGNFSHDGVSITGTLAGPYKDAAAAFGDTGQLHRAE